MTELQQTIARVAVGALVGSPAAVEVEAIADEEPGPKLSLPAICDLRVIETVVEIEGRELLVAELETVAIRGGA